MLKVNHQLSTFMHRAASKWLSWNSENSHHFTFFLNQIDLTHSLSLWIWILQKPSQNSPNLITDWRIDYFSINQIQSGDWCLLPINHHLLQPLSICTLSSIPQTLTLTLTLTLTFLPNSLPPLLHHHHLLHPPPTLSLTTTITTLTITTITSFSFSISINKTRPIFQFNTVQFPSLHPLFNRLNNLNQSHLLQILTPVPVSWLSSAPLQSNNNNNNHHRHNHSPSLAVSLPLLIRR